jgi:hypothetical protein
VALDGHLLRAKAMQRSKTPDGWLEYLEDVAALHFASPNHGLGMERVEECRREFLRHHGASSTSALLWTNLSQAKAN